MPFARSVTGRTVYAIGSGEGAAYMSGLNINRAKIAAFTLGGFFAGLGGLYLALQTSSGNADIPQAGAYTLNSIAAVVIGGTSLLGGVGSAIGSIFGALVLRTISFNFRIFEIRSASAALVRRGGAAGGGQSRCAQRAACQKHPRIVQIAGGNDNTSTTSAPSAGFAISADDKPIIIAACFILVILAIGTAYTLITQGSAPLLSPGYLLQQLQVGAFLGVVAAGMMLVILLGHIDLSIPWTVAAAAMMATAVGGAGGHSRRPGRRPCWSAWSTGLASPICASPR